MDAKKKLTGKQGHSFTHCPLSPFNVCVSWQDVLSKMAQGAQQEEGKDDAEESMPSVALIP